MVDERAFTASLRRLFAAVDGRGVVGIGDDAAVVPAGADRLVLACDPVIERVHFAPGAPWAAVGHKAVHRNLADLAAMGARLDWALLSAQWPATRPLRQLRALLRGAGRAVEAAGGCVVGGDVATVASGGAASLTVAVVGSLCGPRPLTRAGARTGDLLHVTGPLGGSGHRQRHLRVRAPMAAGAALARCAAVGAVMDVSDGLALDLHTLLQASSEACGRRLGAELEAEAVPVSAAARSLARAGDGSALDHALGDGEDHELLFTLRRGRALPATAALGATARRPIGRVVAAPGRGPRLWLIWRDGRRQALAPRGWQHRLGGGR